MEKSKMKLEINEDAKFVIETFLERGLYQNATEVVGVALELLYQKQMDEDSIKWNESTTPDEVIYAQLDVMEREEEVLQEEAFKPEDEVEDFI